MKIPHVLTDGGRALSHPNEKLDCVVRSIALGLNINYHHAHMITKDWGRKDRHKTYKMEQLFQFIKELIPLEIHTNTNITLSKFVNQYYKGTYIVYKKGHLFTVKDGVVYDSFENGGKSKIIWFVQVKDSSPII